MISPNWNPAKKDLRVFSILCIGFALLVGWLLRGSGSPRAALGIGAVGLLVGIWGLARPESIRLLYVIWMGLAYPIGFVISNLILGSVFYLIVTPIGVLQRLFGWDPLNKRLDREAESYWIRRPEKRPLATYFRQY